MQPDDINDPTFAQVSITSAAAFFARQIGYPYLLREMDDRLLRLANLLLSEHEIDSRKCFDALGFETPDARFAAIDLLKELRPDDFGQLWLRGEEIDPIYVLGTELETN